MKLLLHAPTAAALDRARRDYALLAGQRIDGLVRIVATGEGALHGAATPHGETDYSLVLCADTLAAASVADRPGVETTPNGALLIARLQRKGWTYVRA